MYTLHNLDSEVAFADDGVCYTRVAHSLGDEQRCVVSCGRIISAVAIALLSVVVSRRRRNPSVLSNVDIHCR